MFACPVAPTKDKRNKLFQIVDLAQFCDLVAMALIDSEKLFKNGVKKCMMDYSRSCRVKTSVPSRHWLSLWEPAKSSFG